jgi:hypothetical protein
MTDQLVAVAAEALARRGDGAHDDRAGGSSHGSDNPAGGPPHGSGSGPGSGFSRNASHGLDVRPEVQIAAIALVGLWSVQFRSLAKHLADGTGDPDGPLAPDRLHDAVTADVRRAADLLDAGLAAFAGAPARTPDASRAAGTRTETARTTPRTPVRPTVENMPR